MMVVSDFEVRRRAPGTALRSGVGGADAAVVAELAVYGLVALFLFFQLAHPPSFRRPVPALTALWAFGVVLVFTVLYAIYPTLAAARGVQLLVTCGLAHAIGVRADRSQLHWLAHAYVVLVTASVGFGLAVPYPRTELQANRFTWLYVHPVMAATYLGLSVVLLLGILLRNRSRTPSPRWPTWIYLILLAVNVGALLATRTRGALAGCLVGCFVVAIVGARRTNRLDIAVLSIIVAVLAGILAMEEIVSFLQRGETSESLRTLTSRTVLWEEAIDRFWDRPLFGYGLTASRGIFFDTVGLGGGHNALINVMVDAGAFGVIVFLSLIGVLIRSARSVRRRPGVGDDVPIVLGALAFLVVNSVTAEFMATPGNVANIWFLVLAGWVVALIRLAPPAEAPPSRLWPGAGVAAASRRLAARRPRTPEEAPPPAAG
jgi:O-antigen ligase